ncbi:arginine kinase-like [Bombus pyrosoma]|uniref:arginine kinase-like n=1 Tax=Bombus pyrosoma TaxID=396416 RepID=UPI001CB9A080|nr:arginine kinase-like [Bombus pyrosoma]
MLFQILIRLLVKFLQLFDVISLLFLAVMIRGTKGEHTESEGGIYDISNKRRLGLTEREVVFEMRNGVLELIKQEKQLQED